MYIFFADLVGVLNCFNDNSEVQAKVIACGSKVASDVYDGHYEDKCK